MSKLIAIFCLICNMIAHTSGMPVEVDSTAVVRTNAHDSHIYGAVDFDPISMYKLMYSKGEPKPDTLMLYKATSSLDYRGYYFDMAYGGLDGYTSSESKREVIKRFDEAWDSGSDPAAVNIKKQIQGDENFPKVFVEELMKVSYSYSYHAFAEKYGVAPNRGYADAVDVAFVESEYEDSKILAQSYLAYKECTFYEYDFDGDGEDEIGIPQHSGAGGAFGADGFGIYKKNADGLYDTYSSGPHCTFRDAMRLVKFEDRYYFVVNPFSDTGDALHDIFAQSIDKNGKKHFLYIDCAQYAVKPVFTKTEDAFAVGYGELIAKLDSQAKDAIAATKRHVIYTPSDTETVDISEIKTDTVFHVEHDEKSLQAVDINNDGQQEFLYKGLTITQSKYYDEWNRYGIYNTADEARVAAEERLGGEEFYGTHSQGNIYDTLPVAGRIVQLWTTEFGGKNYIAALAKTDLVYSMRVYLVEGERTRLVNGTLYFDEMQDMSVRFTDPMTAL